MIRESVGEDLDDEVEGEAVSRRVGEDLVARG
jgi:hypothetical protein